MKKDMNAEKPAERTKRREKAAGGLKRLRLKRQDVEKLLTPGSSRSTDGPASHGKITRAPQ